MSFCRWDPACDVYVFEDVNGGFTTMLIDGSEANHATAAECADHLLALRQLGWKVPQYAVDDLRAEPA